MIERVTFIGSKQRGLIALNTINSLAPDKLCSIVTLDDRGDARCKLDEFQEFAKSTGKKLHILTRPSQIQSVIAEDSPEMCLVVNWYWILEKSVLQRVPKGFLGIHPSLLPKYRGWASLVWSIINGDKESGISLFYFSEAMDTGDIVAQKRFGIGDDDTISEVMEKANSATKEILIENYQLLLQGKAPRISQNHDEATYCSQRKPEDGRIDWRATNVEIHNAIRAQTHPYPGSFCLTGKNKKLYIWKSKLFPQEYYGVPGLVVQVLEDCVIVTCGKGAICLYVVQLESSTQEAASRALRYGVRLK